MIDWLKRLWSSWLAIDVAAAPGAGGIESVCVSATSRKLRGDWTVTIDNRWPVYVYPRDSGLIGTIIRDDRCWPRGASDRPPFALLGAAPSSGDEVLWKGSPHDYLWDRGVVTLRGSTWYVDGPHSFAALEWSPADACWVTTGASSNDIGRLEIDR